MIKKHMRKSQANPQGAIVEREGTIHISNVMKVADFDARAARHSTAPVTA
jgi:large subunit ribosomal protein L24